VSLAVVLALAIGFSLGLFGGGGSILAVPVLVYAVGLAPKAAITTSLLVVGLTSAAALVPHARAGRVAWRTGLVFGAAGMAGAFGGGQLARFFAGEILLLLFTAVMVAAAVAMWRGPATRRAGAPSTARPTRKIVADGLGVGLVAGLVGAGGGFLIVPALALLGDLPMATAVGTSLLVIAMNSFAGFAGYLGHVDVDLRLALAFSGAAIAGAVIGAQLVAGLRPERLRRGFALFVLAVAGFMLWQQHAALARPFGGDAAPADAALARPPEPRC
jgi:uncharacterized membrane protein YfcA